MSSEMIQQKLIEYQCESIQDQENALKEIAQEIALLALSRAGFFRIAAFQGGTCLRILYGLERFSEDLDFVLEKADPNFEWTKYLQQMTEEFNAYGYTLEIKSKNKLDKAIKTTFLKLDSEGGILIIKDLRTQRPMLQIKLEVDTHPPDGATYELKYLDFPLAFSIQTQDLPSLFASKSHALLCREYTKGRDWYDFIWYVSRQTQLNFILLSHALNQAGPWKNKGIKVTLDWYVTELTNKIKSINWDYAKQDVARFLKPRTLFSLNSWSEDFFITRLDKLAQYLSE